MKHLNRYIRPWYGYIALTLAIKLGGAILELFIPSILKTILDDIVPTGNRNQIFLWGGAMLACAAGCLIFNVVANRMSARSAGQITLRIRHDLFGKLTTLSARQMDQLTVSSAVSRLTSDTYNLNQMFSRIQRMGIRGPILLLGGIVITLVMDAPLALVLVAMLPFIALIVYFVTKKGVPLYTKQQEVLDHMVQTVQENISGIRIIKALSKTQAEQERFSKINGELSEVDQKANNTMAITNPAATLVLNFGLTLVVVVGAFRVNSGSILPGTIIAFLNYFTIILNAMLGITNIFVMCSKGIASGQRVTEVLLLSEDLQLQNIPAEISTAHIEFRHVDFSYNNVENNLRDINFSLHRGQTLGILGATGSGKSTIIQLLLRFYDPDRGQILLDGRDLRSIPAAELRTKFGVVFQNDFIMAGSLKENILYFRSLSEENCRMAREDAQAEEFISAYEEKEEHEIASNGNDLSGGQKQRLLISRALAGNPEILILDDASSALDYRTDAALRKALHRRHTDTTRIIVAQRISSVQDADQILMLDDGRIIGIGSHEQLLRECPSYREIAQIQMGEKEGM